MQPEKVDEFIEQVGLYFAKWGMPRMAGRLLACLIVCEPAHQSAAQLAERLSASKASISTSTRLLIRAGLVERIGVLGERAVYFRLAAMSVESLIRREVEGLRVGLKMIDMGLALLADSDSFRRQWLGRLRSLFGFFEREYPVLEERFRQEQSELERKGKRS